MLVTIFSDASHCPFNRVGGWGAWAKSDRGSLTAHGSLRGTVMHSNEAEIYAAVNAVHMAVTSPIYQAGDVLLLQSDSTAALEALQTRKAHLRWARQGYDRLQKLVADYAVDRVMFQHVKGHQGGKTRRSWVNTLCDRMAKEGMRAARTQRNLNPSPRP